jgi:hypothetical protein
MYRNIITIHLCLLTDMNIGNLCYIFFLCSLLLWSECHNGIVLFIKCDEHRGGSKYKTSDIKLKLIIISLICALNYFIYSEGAM